MQGALVIAGLTAFNACFLRDLDRYDREYGNPECDGACVSDSGSPDGAPDASSKGKCPEGRGPRMVDLGILCVDGTEVTNGQYSEFLKSPLTTARCSWKTRHTPTVWPAADDVPVVGVDWCDAYDFCVWAGKHLCGRLDGTPGAIGDLKDPGKSAWFFACSHDGDGLHEYPYGNGYEPSSCNGAAPTTGRLVAVGSSPKCEGGWPGVFDMSGNAWEWTDECDVDAGPAAPDALCLYRGGTWDSPGDKLSCDSFFLGSRSSPDYALGFRCCAP